MKVVTKIVFFFLIFSLHSSAKAESSMSFLLFECTKINKVDFDKVFEISLVTREKNLVDIFNNLQNQEWNKKVFAVGLEYFFANPDFNYDFNYEIDSSIGGAAYMYYDTNKILTFEWLDRMNHYHWFKDEIKLINGETNSTLINGLVEQSHCEISIHKQTFFYYFKNKFSINPIRKLIRFD